MSRTLLTALMLGIAAPALAQPVTTAPPSPAAPRAATAAAAPDLGPPLPGVCLLNVQGAITTSKVGQMASKRLQQFADEAKSQFTAERAPLDSQAQTLRAQAQSLSQADLQQRAQTLDTAMGALQNKYEGRARQLDSLKQQVTVKIAESANPLITPLYTAHHCSLILDRNVVVAGNMSGDLTPELVASMDTNLTDINFTMPPWPGQAAAPAAAPAPAEKPAAAAGKKKK